MKFVILDRCNRTMIALKKFFLIKICLIRFSVRSFITAKISFVLKVSQKTQIILSPLWFLRAFCWNELPVVLTSHCCWAYHLNCISFGKLQNQYWVRHLKNEISEVSGNIWMKKITVEMKFFRVEEKFFLKAICLYERNEKCLFRWNYFLKSAGKIWKIKMRLNVLFLYHTK